MVYVYAANVSSLPDPEVVPEVMDGLTEERKEKILHCRQKAHRKQRLGASLLLKKALLLHGIPMETIRYGRYGKPEADGICFNLSHSRDMAVCVISDQAVGCDVEKIRGIRDGIAERFFTKSEVAYLNSLEEDERKHAFFRLWTMKESYMKMTGEGMHLGLDGVEFVFEDTEVQVYRDGRRCSCFIKEYAVPGYKVTVCANEAKFTDLIELPLLEA